MPTKRDLGRRRGVDRAQVQGSGDGRPDLPVGHQPDQPRDARQHGAACELEPRLRHQRAQRLFEARPPLFAVRHVYQNADEHRRHVLEHHTLRHDRASGQERDDEDNHDVGEDQEPHGLPERMLGVAAQGGRQPEAHLCAARYWTSASSCEAFIMEPNVLGMMPASFSYPLATDDAGSRIFFRIDSAARREPTCVRSGAITCPCPSSLWQARHPAAWMMALGSVDPPAKPPPPPPPPPPPVGEVVEVLEVAGMSEALTSTVPPCDSRNAITDHTCAGE